MKAATEGDVRLWAAEFEAVTERLGKHFARSEPRQRATAYLRGLMSEVERKNGWQLAEVAGDAAPYGMQHLLGRAAWDADAVRDDLRSYVAEHLADTEQVLIIDETGFLKKGTKSVGVKRQYSGTAGRIENCQIGVFLVLASAHGRAFIDRDLYLPKEWADDAERRNAANVPKEVTFETKPQLALRMLRRAWKAGVSAPWVTADTVYGSNTAFRRALEARQQGFVLAVNSQQRLWIEFEQWTMEEMATEAPNTAWQRLSAGDGAKGPRLYDWAVWPFNGPDPTYQHWVLARRSITDPSELAYYFCAGPSGTPLEELVRVAGSRWAVEECFETAKGQTGLDQYEVRSWHGWYRHVTMTLFAHACLTVIRAVAAQPSPKPPAPSALQKKPKC